MKRMSKKAWQSVALGLALSLGMYAATPTEAAAAQKPLAIEEQGSFTVGGTYKEKPGKFTQENFVAEDGQRAYGDFAYVEYQKPVKSKKLPLIFQHGGAQSKRTWESGPDGREGFNTMFVRAGYSVYLVDQPRSGEANLSTEAVTPDTPWATNPMYGGHSMYCPASVIMMRQAIPCPTPSSLQARRIIRLLSKAGRSASVL